MTQNLENQSSPQKTVRLLRPSVIVLCGPAACGKSTFAARHFRPTQIISSDQARALVCDDERDQRFQTQAFALVHFLIEQRLELNRLCVVDSTALTPAARKNLLDLARKYQAPCVVFLFAVPLEKCLERDAGRERTVGRAVIERQHQLFEQAAASIRQEGFDQVVEIPDAEMDRVKIEIVFRPPARKPAAPARAEPRPDVPRPAPATVARRGPGPAVVRPAPAAPAPAPAPRPPQVQSPVPAPASQGATPAASAPEVSGAAPPSPAGPGQGSSES
jgi:protein phosphatase